MAVSDKNNDNNENNNDKFKLTIEIALNNIRQENPQIIKLVAFINGEIQTKTIDIINDVKSSKISVKTPPFEFNKSNDVSKIDAGDEYFVCGYILKQDAKIEPSNTNLNNKTMLYDCNEGRLASPDKGSPKIFSTLTKFEESSAAYQSSSVKSLPPSPPNSKVVKITLLNPTNVIEHLDDAKFVAMVKGEYQIKKINIKDEIKKSKNEDTISIPFTFDINTKIGPIQQGDLFFGCITADGYSSSENSECEVRLIKHLDKANKLPVAH
ncbi:MAG: hypothetical protein ACR2F1_14880 [Nitrososphaeraceae archaeon]